MSALRPALRLAWRELWRRKGRTVLVVLMIAVPVAAFVVGTSVARTQNTPMDVRMRNSFGGGNAGWSVAPNQAFDATPAGEAAAFVERVGAQVPGAPTATLLSAGGTAAGAEGDVAMTVVGGPIADPLVAPRYELREGRFPQAGDEVVLTPDLADALGATVGGPVAIEELDLEGTVVGIADRVMWSDARELLTPQLPDLDPTTVAAEVLVRLPDDPTAVQRFADIERSRQSQLGLDPRVAGTPDLRVTNGFRYHTAPENLDQAIQVTFVGEALAFAVLGLIISVAFTVGARRQVRMLGLVAANGGSPRDVRAVVVSQGLWCGVVGAALGLGLGLATLAGLWPFAPELLGYHPSWWTVSVVDLAVIGIIGVGAAVASSWLPARTVSRASVLQSLAGRRPVPPMGRRLAVAGVAIASLGLGALVVVVVLSATGWAVGTKRQIVTNGAAIMGGLAILAGATIGAHGLVALVGRVGSGAGGSVRLALRSLARQRTRYGSVVAGVAALTTGALLITAGLQPSLPPLFSSTPALPRPSSATVFLGTPLAGSTMSADEQARLAPVSDLVPGATFTPLATVALSPDYGDPDRGLGPLAATGYVATPEVIEALDLSPTARQVLGDGRAVAFSDGQQATELDFDERTNTWVRRPLRGVNVFDRGNVGAPLAMTTVPAEGTAPAVMRSFVSMTLFLVTPEQLVAAGVPVPAAGTVLLTSPAPLTEEQADGLGRIGGGRPEFRLRSEPVAGPPAVQAVLVPHGGGGEGLGLAWLGFLGASLLVTAFVVAIGTALAAADSREERDALEALGAPPALVRRAEGLKVAVVALLGAVVATVAGGLPAAVLTVTEHLAEPPSLGVPPSPQEAIPWTAYVPWTTLVWVFVVVPAVLGLLTMVGSGLRARWRPVAASQFRFD